MGEWPHPVSVLLASNSNLSGSFPSLDLALALRTEGGLKMGFFSPSWTYALHSTPQNLTKDRETVNYLLSKWFHLINKSTNISYVFLPGSLFFFFFNLWLGPFPFCKLEVQNTLIKHLLFGRCCIGNICQNCLFQTSQELCKGRYYSYSTHEKWRDHDYATSRV